MSSVIDMVERLLPDEREFMNELPINGTYPVLFNSNHWNGERFEHEIRYLRFQSGWIPPSPAQVEARLARFRALRDENIQHEKGR